MVKEKSQARPFSGPAIPQHGQVTEANLMMDRMTGRSRGFAFVTFSTPEEAQKAIEARQQVFKDMKKANDVMSAMLKGQREFDAALVAENVPIAATDIENLRLKSVTQLAVGAMLGMVLVDPNDKGGDDSVYYEDKWAMIWNIERSA